MFLLFSRSTQPRLQNLVQGPRLPLEASSSSSAPRLLSLPALCHGWSPVHARARAHPPTHTHTLKTRSPPVHLPSLLSWVEPSARTCACTHTHTHMLKTRSPPVHLIPLLPLVSSRCPAEGQVQSRRCELASMESLFFCGPARPAGTEAPEAAPCLRVPYPGLIEWPWRSRRGSFSGR